MIIWIKEVSDQIQPMKIEENRSSNKKLRRKKCLKVKIYFVLSFIQKQVVPFWKGEKLPIFCYKYLFTWKMWFFSRFGAKNWKGRPDNFETSHKEKSDVLEKKPRIYRSSPSGSNWVPKIWPTTKQHSGSAYQWQPGSQIFPIWNKSHPRKWEQRYSFCQILNFQFP